MSTTRPALPDAARLDRRVTLQEKVETQDEYGQAIVTWVDMADTWAEAIPGRGVERTEALQLVAITDMIFRIRWRNDLSAAATRVRFDGRSYDVLGISELGRRELLQLDATWSDAPTTPTRMRLA
jgi:SPP1 family predicted phage head-tail adaptor